MRETLEKNRPRSRIFGFIDNIHVLLENTDKSGSSDHIVNMCR